ncbi:hypothetical protein DIPPA_32368 [Diplonema papillatum]|nr:hypothetical protein DIPPA_32368 [Diplonema papillatum]
MEASAGGVKKLWKAAGDAPVESFATRGEGGPAKVKVTPGVVRAVLPAELDVTRGWCKNAPFEHLSGYRPFRQLIPSTK